MAVDQREVSGEPAGQDVAAGQTEDASQSQEQGRSGPFDWIRDTFFGRGNGDQGDGAEGDASEGTGELPDGAPATDKSAVQDSETVTLTRAELQARIRQSARDQIQAERLAEARQNETRQQRQERLRIAREEPYKLADEEIERLEGEEQRESYAGQFVESVRPVFQLVDQQVVGQIVMALPDDAARQKVLDSVPTELSGIAERAHLVKSGLEALQAHWRAEGARDAEKRLRTNGTIVKQMLSEQREAAEEPDLIPAAGVPHRTDMDSILRAAAGVH